MIVQSDSSEIYKMIKLAVTEAMREEKMNMFFASLADVSDEEMQEIERIPLPSDNSEDYLNISSWFANENNN